MAIFPNLPPQLIYWHRPAPIFTARVNMPGAFVYPVQDIPFDGVTVGAYTDVAADMLVTFGSAEGLDDLGRTRLRAAATSTVLKISRASQGFEDGQIDIVDNAYITVLDDFRVWSKIPTIVNHEEFKDTDLAVGTLTQQIPPVAIMGPDRARRIDTGTGVARLFFDSANSYAVATGASIVSVTWEIKDGTYALGSVATDTAIHVDFPAGFRWVALTVVDSNGRTHTTRRLVLAHDPANSLCVSGMQVQRITRTQTGLSVPLRLLQDLPRASFPDGSHILIFEDRDPAIYGTPDPADLSDLLFTGWHNVDEASSTAQEAYLRRETVLTCVDVLGRLDGLPGFPQRIEIPDDDGIWTWGEMDAPNMDKFLVYLAHWHSTAPSVADFFVSGTWTDYPFVMFDSGGDTLYNQLQRQAARIVPDHNFTSTRYGQMQVVVNPQYQNPVDRTSATQGSLLEQSWSAIEFGYNRNPRVHTLRGSAILTGTAYNSEGELDTAFSIAPGTAPGQGGREQKLGERLAQSQQDLNDTIGHHYARMNARYGDITVTLNLNADPWDFDPAAFTWLPLHTSAATAPQRGLDFTTIRCLVKEVSIDYIYGEEATTYRARVVLEPETVGLPALTEVTEEVLPVGVEPTPFVPPAFGDPSIYYGNMAAYILWNNTRVMRTWDIQAASPVWEFVDTGITGDIYDGVYVQHAATTVGMWLMTSTAIWWCDNIMATTPSWSAVLPIATVQAADATPTTGVVEFKCMAEYASQPGFLIVATGPVANDISYPHAYFWRTTDKGANWTQIDMNGFLKQSPFRTPPTGNRGYCHASRFNMGIYRSEPTIWCVRNVPTDATDDWQAVFKSTDSGDTWSRVYEFPDQANNFGPGAFLIPYPDIDDPTYVVRGGTGASSRLPLWKSTDAWATAAALTIPTGYDGFGSRWRVNSRTFDPLHVIGWMRHTATAHYHLMESFDAGATWALVYNSGETESGGDARHQTPNGWPADALQYVLVRAVDNSGSTTAVVQLTLDNFATAPADKAGNLNALLSGNNWSSGLNSGFALPRVAPNT